MAGALAGLGFTAACGAPQAASQQNVQLSTAPVTIQFYKRGTIPEADVATMLKDWTAAHPTWKVELVQNKSNLETLAPHIAAGDKIDVLGWYKTAREMNANTGIPKPLDDLVKRDKFAVNKFSAKELDLVGKGKDGKLLSLYYAWGGNITAVFYNRALFKQAGVPEPPASWDKAWTWDEFRENMRKLTKKSGGTATQVGFNQYGQAMVSPLVLTDAKWISDDWKKIDATSNELLTTYERLADITAKDGSAMTSQGVDLGLTNQEQAFLAGKVAMHTICCGPAGPAKKFTDAGMDWAFAPTPKMKYAAPDLQSNLVMLTKLGAYPDHGWELMKHLIDENRWGNAEGRLPAISSDAVTWVKETFKATPNARAEVLAESVKYTRPVDKIKYHPLGDGGDLYKVIEPVLNDCLAGKAQVRASIPPLQGQLQAIMDRAPDF
ncbi:MAG TPA: ABC transporter substrate-binding protein [Chloroflexota bacterium]|nr:ABC transporter substrate-binding protein [Chloroflexota bacterium]